MRRMVMLSSFMLATALPATASPPPPPPLAGLHYLVGTWNCTYRAGASRFAYGATYAYDLDGRTLRQTSTWAGGGDEELLAYDAQRKAWTAAIVDDHGNTTIVRATSSDPYHYAYRSIYPDASIAVMFDRISATEYTLHATVRAGGKTTTSVDTCLRGTH